MHRNQRTMEEQPVLLNYERGVHGSLLGYWQQEEARHFEATRRIPTRFERVEASLNRRVERQGDALVARIRDVFNTGLGVKWGDDQIRVFNAFLASCLPYIYGASWGDEKTRVLREWRLNRQVMYSLVNMARRNGKTFVVAGTTATMILCLPNLKVAIFSTCKRTSQMMLSAALDMLEKAFELDTHVHRQDYLVVTKNMESVCFEGPDGTKRLLGSFPGSVRVRNVYIFCVEREGCQEQEHGARRIPARGGRIHRQALEQR